VSVVKPRGPKDLSYLLFRRFVLGPRPSVLERRGRTN
jgi:hypothetical protein